MMCDRAEASLIANQICKDTMTTVYDKYWGVFRKPNKYNTDFSLNYVPLLSVTMAEPSFVKSQHNLHQNS